MAEPASQPSVNMPADTVPAALNQPSEGEKPNDKQQWAHLQAERNVAFREIEPAEELGPVHQFQRKLDNQVYTRQSSLQKMDSIRSTGSAREYFTSPPGELEESDMNAWANLDRTGEDQYGVGLFIKQLSGENVQGQMEVASVLPGSAAAKNKVVRVYDRLTDVDDRSIAGLSLSQVQRMIFGTPGTYVMLDFDRVTDIRFKGDAWGQEETVSRSGKHHVERYPFRVTLMRGSPEYINVLEEKKAGKDSEESRKHDALLREVEEERRIVMELENRVTVEEGRIQQAKERDEKNRAEAIKLQEKLSRLQSEFRLESRAAQSLRTSAGLSRPGDESSQGVHAQLAYGTMSQSGHLGYA